MNLSFVHLCVSNRPEKKKKKREAIMVWFSLAHISMLCPVGRMGQGGGTREKKATHTHTQKKQQNDERAKRRREIEPAGSSNPLSSRITPHISSLCTAKNAVIRSENRPALRDPSFISVHLLHRNPLLTPPISQCELRRRCKANGDPIHVSE